MKRLPWDHAADIVPVTTILTTPVVLVVPSGIAVHRLSHRDGTDQGRKDPRARGDG
jgi:hypothetical protein